MEPKLRGEFHLSNNNDNEVKAEEKPKEHTSKFPDTHSQPHFYSSFNYYPKDITFEEQKHGEEIILFMRRHFVTNVPWIALSIFLAILPVTFPILFSGLPFPLPSPNLIALLLAFYYVFIFGFILLNFTLWYFHNGFVTNLRVVDIDITGILFRQVTETENRNIEDVGYTQNGFIRSLFNYGDVHVQTAGSAQNIEFDRVPKPAVAARIISEQAHTI